ncbi:MAG: hypothetical protein A2X36_07530 [Elusimicrobia bacterium GWA2_69_24]|nr:MAG: hypothetical protein A2X36_07530 [Elusimicrobia bacterium GWA2_69_24]
MLKGALVGFGQVAERAHAPAFLRVPGLAVTAVADAGAERLAAAARIFPGARTYPTLEALLRGEPELDFVDIATPPHLHAAQIGMALQRGCHVLCEKPLTLSTEEFEAVLRRARETRRLVFPVHNWKHAPLFQTLKGLLARGAIGRVRHAEWHVLRTQPAAVAGSGKGNWRTDAKLSGGGILMDHGWHAFYLLGWLLGSAPVSAAGILKPAAGAKGEGATDVEATSLIRYGCGASALIHLSWAAPRRDHWGVLYGTTGSIDVLDDRLAMRHGDAPPQSYAFPEGLSKGSAHPEWFAGTLREFAAALRAGDGDRGEAALEEARHCLRLLGELYQRGARKAGSRTVKA